MHSVRKDPGQKGKQGHRRKRYNGQKRINIEHETECGETHEDRINKRHAAHSGSKLNGRQVIGCKRHRPAGGCPLKENLVKLKQVRKHPVSQIDLDKARKSEYQLPPDKPKHCNRKGEQHDVDTVMQQAARGCAALLEQIDRIFYNTWDEKLEQVDQHQGGKTARKP
jgi:hypothetical protein